MKYLVTGGAGFIGTHLSNFLIKIGHNVIVLDDLSFGERKLLDPGIELVVGSITDFNLCMKVTSNVDGVFHLAAFSRSGPSINMQEQCHQINTLGTLMLLEACRLNKVKRIVYSGSSTYYGNTIGKQSENFNGDFLNFYGLTKFVGELYVKQYLINYKLEYNILRYFNVYGPGQPSSGPYALVLGIFLNNFINNSKIEIHGTGEQRRDFVHVYDVVKANLAAMDCGIYGEVFNVGSGINYSILEIANFFPVDKYFTARREGDAFETLADISKAKSILKWEPEVSLEEGINKLINDRCTK